MTQPSEKPPAHDGPEPGSVWVVLPTYNERDNLESIVAAVRAQVPLATVLVVDDGSPDGTGDVADLLAGGDPHVRVLHRAAKGGLWPAYVAGIDTALAEGAQIVVQMDADGSHDPAVLPELVGAVRSGYDFAIGSRYVPGGGTPDWPLSRRLVSRGGNLFAQLILGLPYPDTTGGFRAWSADFLRALDFRSIRATGYVCMIEMAYRAHRQRANVSQVPITFMNRRAGVSKMSGGIFAEALVQVVNLRLTEWGRRRRGTRTSW